MASRRRRRGRSSMVLRCWPMDADVHQIRTAAQEILSDPRFRDEARRRSAALAGLDGAAMAADSVEAIIPIIR